MSFEIGEWLSKPASGDALPCTLFVPGEGSKRKEVPIPLRRRDVTAFVYVDGTYAETKETLSYVSDTDCTAVFRFPLPPRAAIYRFRTVMGDREVVTKVKPRAEAREEYELAVQQGHTALHMSQHQRGASVFEVSLGNLTAHEEVVVEFSYLRLLESFGSTLEWMHTATWVPPYIGSQGDRMVGVDKVAATMPSFAAKVSYKLSYDVTIVAPPGAIRSVESPLPTVKIATPSQPTDPSTAATNDNLGCGLQAGGTSASWRAIQSGDVSDPSQDFTLLIELDPTLCRRSSLRVQKTPASRGGEVRTLALATFVPPMAPPTAAGADAQQKPQLRKEIWFVVDCSGSMDGAPISQAKQAALFFVRDLPADSGVRFNMTCFGSSYKSLYDDGCHLYDSKSERKAVEWIQANVQANMGGTEILATLKHIYRRPVATGYTRELIFLTDGGISGHEEQAVFNLVTATQSSDAGGKGDKEEGEREGEAARASRLTHVLSLGIGHGVHRSLLDGIAQRSNGLAAYVVDDESISAKTAFLKKAAITQCAALRPKLVARGALVRASPHVLPQRIFPGEPLNILLEVISCEADATLELTADCSVDGEATDPLHLTLPLGLMAACGAAVEEGEALGVLHAMSYISSLLNGTSPLHKRPDGTPLPAEPSADMVKDAVVRLAVAEHLVTPYTSAVGVRLSRDPADPTAAATVVEVPLQLPTGRTMWGPPGHPASGRPTNKYCMAMQLRCSAAAPVTEVPELECVSEPQCCISGETATAPGAKVPVYMEDCAMSFKRMGRTLQHRSGGSGILNSITSAASAFFGAMKSAGSAGSGAPVPYAALPRRGAPLRAEPTAVAAAPGNGIRKLAIKQEKGCNNFGEHPKVPKADVKESLGDSSEDVRGCGLSWGSSSEETAGVQPTPPLPKTRGLLQGQDLLDYLNLLRHTQGYWSPSPELATALGLQEAELKAAPKALGVKAAAEDTQAATETPSLAIAWPDGLSEDGWATVVVLAALRKALASKREVWADMEAKALEWLKSCWPVGARSVGMTVLAVVKLLP